MGRHDTVPLELQLTSELPVRVCNVTNIIIIIVNTQYSDQNMLILAFYHMLYVIFSVKIVIVDLLTILQNIKLL